MKKAYHSTTIEGAKKILESGFFKMGCYFAFDVNDALKFAGPIVFEVFFEEDGFKNIECENPAWQFWLRTDLPISYLKSRHWTEDPLNQAKPSEREDDAPSF